MSRAQALLREALAVAAGTERGQLLLQCSARGCHARRQFPGLTLPDARRQAAREGWCRAADGRELCPRCNPARGRGRRQLGLFDGDRRG